MWACYHPLDQAGHEDRMITHELVSADGLHWSDCGPVLQGTAGRWDARGARVTAVLNLDPLTVLYDGRPSAATNWYETTGLARAIDGRLSPVGSDPVAASPLGDGSLRYVSAVALPNGRTRFYFEASRADGAHDLMSCLR